ncbi:hypothetical protein F4801DRAFT_516598 [Xylaria longipes]|nr:hypothetical protein F4801DRAFT_516598 [Xylaria longipes]
MGLIVSVLFLGSLSLVDSPRRPSNACRSRGVNERPCCGCTKHGFFNSRGRGLQDPSLYNYVPEGFQEKAAGTYACEMLLACRIVDAFSELQGVRLGCRWE